MLICQVWEPLWLEVSILEVKWDSCDLWRYDDHKNNDTEQDSLTFKLKSSEAVACDRAGDNLKDRGHEVKDNCVYNSIFKLHYSPNVLDVIKCEALRDPNY